MQLDGTLENANAAVAWMKAGDVHAVPCTDDEAATVWGVIIKTLEGNMDGRAGDYIIRGVHGEFYPCKPEIFAKTYDVVGNLEAKE